VEKGVYMAKVLVLVTTAVAIAAFACVCSVVVVDDNDDVCFVALLEDAFVSKTFVFISKCRTNDQDSPHWPSHLFVVEHLE